ncbi:MAG: hypothetical protein U0167_04960 [bacterium]
MSVGAAPGAGEPADFAARCAEVERLAASRDAEAGEALARLLLDPSWYLRERVVEALGARHDVADAIRRALREGEWWARASACDVIARRADAAALDDLVAGVEDRNVFLQKSAVRAMVAVAERTGLRFVAERLAALDPAQRRRLLARVGHQAPHWVDSLAAELAELPPGALAPGPAEGGAGAAAGEEDVEARALVRFRAWLDAAAGAPRERRA